MEYEPTQNLVNDLSHLLKDTSNCDVKIRVGKEPNIKEFKVHSFVLSSSYIYLGTFSVDNNKISLVDILIASDEIELLEVYRQLEKRLLENELAWKFPKDFITLYHYRDRFNNLYEVILELVYLVDDVLQYFSDPNSKPLLKNLPLRVSVYPLNSKIINANDAAIVASWIDKKKGIPYRLKDIPIKFELIYRASHEGFNTNKFHECCDNKGPTVVIIKVRNSGEIIGGYNSLDWRSVKYKGSHYNRFYIDHKCKTSNSFIFSLFSSTNGVNPVLSRVTSKKEAIIWCKDKGPCFGLQDLWINNNSMFGRSKQKYYKKKIINRETFEIEDYEVFQIIDKRFSPYKLINRVGSVLSIPVLGPVLGPFFGPF
ncbi:uncharacterized protein OCT59_004473 [Rhizophagus irregularis]|uniref:uncharacterized protein n=1 Tax=Rhizophagus irregularis TaxID=588596 RepID=UPI00332ED27B|nr:hypothetical protein OCT59_004473 [Rhizophagus irregularis]